jgi:hypothetical protein
MNQQSIYLSRQIEKLTRFDDHFLNQVQPGKEFEIRFGKYLYSHETKKSIFDSSVDLEFFVKVQKTFANQKSEVKITHEVLCENGIRQIEDVVTGIKTEMAKTRIRVYDLYDYDLRLCLSREESNEGESKASTVTMTRNKYRTSYLFPCGRIDTTRVEESSDGQPGITKYEIELEITDPREKDSVFSLLSVLLMIKQDNFHLIKNKEVREVRKDYTNYTQVRYFIGAQPETLQKDQLSILYKNLYCVTDKADGQRSFLFVTRGSVYFIDGNMKIKATRIKCNDLDGTLIDGELVSNPQGFSFHAFDVLIFKEQDLRGNNNYDFYKRLEIVKQVIDNLEIQKDPIYKFLVKDFIFKDVFVGSKVLVEAERDYQKDGLIFTPVNEPYPLTKKWRNLLKWKPIEMTTMDFFSIKTENHPTEWKLYVQQPEAGGSKGNFSCSGNNNSGKIVLFDISKICKDQESAKDYITFKTDISEEIAKNYCSNTVIEFRWDLELQKFIPLRTRWDKTADPRKHGNHISVACSIWNNITHPVTIDNLLTMTNTNTSGYIHQDSNEVDSDLILYVKTGEQQAYQTYEKSLDSSQNEKGLEFYLDKREIRCHFKKSTVRISNCSHPGTLQVTAVNWESLSDLVQPDSYNAIFCRGISSLFSGSDAIGKFIDILDRVLVTGGKVSFSLFDKDAVLEVIKNRTIEVYPDGSISHYLFKKSENSFGIFLSGIYEESIKNSEHYLIAETEIRDLFKERGYISENVGEYRNLLVSNYLFVKGETIPQQMRKNETPALENYEISEVDNETSISGKVILHKVVTMNNLIDLLNCVRFKKQLCLLVEDQIFESYADLSESITALSENKDFYIHVVENRLESSSSSEIGEIPLVKTPEMFLASYSGKILFEKSSGIKEYCQEFLEKILTVSDQESVKEDVTIVQDQESVKNQKGLESLTIPELKAILRQRGLKISGNKSVLLERLRQPV